MNNEIAQISTAARRAARSQDWASVRACAERILQADGNSAEGHFLAGISEKAANRPVLAAEAFERALQFDANRYDAAVELANQYCTTRRNGDAAALLARYEAAMANSPMYLNMAGTVYVNIGMSRSAWPLLKKAAELQPDISRFQENVAACGVHLGEIEEARGIYQKLLERFPEHRQNHYQLARLATATDPEHVEQMKAVLDRSDDPPNHNIFMYYAIGKELEDLGKWEESFEYYRMAGDAVTSVSDYNIDSDIELVDKLIERCSAEWLAGEAGESAASGPARTPIFIVGLPRTGTTLTERIISSHSRVASVGETQFLQMVLRRESGIETVQQMTAEMVEALVRKDMGLVARGYLDSVMYRLGDEPFFIDKLPFNFLFLGFIAKAWPDARIIHLGRNPMDACFSMYKQVFTWAYKFSYSLEGLGRYYVAYDRLRNHWREILGDRMIEVEYESLVADQEGQTRVLLDRLGLEFEEACLHFQDNEAPSATASSVQVRNRVHTASVNKWMRFEKHLQPLKEHLESAGIPVD